MSQVMEAQAPQAGGVACFAVARAERVAVELALGQRAGKHELLFACAVWAPRRERASELRGKRDRATVAHCRTAATRTRLSHRNTNGRLRPRLLEAIRVPVFRSRGVRPARAS